MQVIIYSSKTFEKEYLQHAADHADLQFHFFPEALNADTAHLAHGCAAAVIFAGDDGSAPALEGLAKAGVQRLAIRAAGYDNVDLDAAHRLGIKVANVPEYSPHAIAEHAVALMLALNRKLVRSDKQVHAYNFDLADLVGRNLHGRTAGIIGTGKIGRVVAAILNGFGCRLLGYDRVRDTQLEQGYGLTYCGLEELCRASDIITIHTCLSPDTRHMIGEKLIRVMKRDAMLINTARGAVVDTAAVVQALGEGRLRSFGADVYEGEKGLFFYDCSGRIPDDPILHRLLMLPNVLLTPHQAFATEEALTNIADTTCRNLLDWEAGRACPNEL